MTSSHRVIKAFAAHKPGLQVAPFQFEAQPLGHQDVEIAISHCGICASDVQAITAGDPFSEYPLVPGHEIVGTVKAIGSGVTTHAIGDRVGVSGMIYSCQDKETCYECSIDKEPHCSKVLFAYGSTYPDGEPTRGGFADYIRVLSNCAYKIPESIPSDVAAPLLCAGLTVYAPLKQYVKPGHRVGVVGIGGLGHVALQFARALGGNPVAFSHSPNKEQAARELGAVEFVNMNNAEDVVKARRSVDVLLVTANSKGQPYDAYLSLIRVGGTLIMVGLTADSMSFHPSSLIYGSINIVGSLIGGPKDAKEMLALAAEKNVRPRIQKLPMREVNTGIRLVKEGTARYRVVLEN
ncbi:hypothetical protein Poli38472_010770 [Pythium oligandrum]|uniref:Enoyl reductase (ER) domain-containing protein n=1 Tax=Pythium oligandrum TaxID=41045 RepID=A0A8K1CGF9_PYTOL|nr:hypothetical protein Poli38472_010770 [Pythium oligandrum]|eukprot:TMW61707.1 hypothetical protein Poli38472_010770 [Pythium oligandrum]